MFELVPTSLLPSSALDPAEPCMKRDIMKCKPVLKGIPGTESKISTPLPVFVAQKFVRVRGESVQDVCRKTL